MKPWHPLEAREGSERGSGPGHRLISHTPVGTFAHLAKTSQAKAGSSGLKKQAQMNCRTLIDSPNACPCLCVSLDL